MGRDTPGLYALCQPKVNLFLRIVRRREDGYHELETVFQSISGGDRLEARPADVLSLTCDDPHLPVDGRNLVIRAAEALREEVPGAVGIGAELSLSKRTPAAAGLGGGSADAAAALVLLNRLWGLGLTDDRLHAVAAALGSDVPFFLLGGAAAAGGRGERLRPLAAPRLHLVLVKPPVSVPTGWAYSLWRREASGGASLAEFEEALVQGDPVRIAMLLRNDLEPGVIRERPEIAAAREWLLKAGCLGARMTGSGSAVFGIARDVRHAREIAARPGAPGTAWTAAALDAEGARIQPLPIGSTPGN